MKNIFTYAILCLLFVSYAKSDEHVFLDSESVEQNDLKQQMMAKLRYAEDDIVFDKVEGQVFVQIELRHAFFN